MNSGSGRWRAEPGACVAVPLDAFTAVYHRPSGQTHLLVEPAPEMLEALSEPLTGDELRDRLAARFEIEGGDDALGARLAELAEAGLIAPT